MGAGQMTVFGQGFYRSKTLREMLSMNVTPRDQVEAPGFVQGRPSTNAKNAGKCLTRIASLFDISGFTLEWSLTNARTVGKPFVKR